MLDNKIYYFEKIYDESINNKIPVIKGIALKRRNNSDDIKKIKNDLLKKLLGK